MSKRMEQAEIERQSKYAGALLRALHSKGFSIVSQDPEASVHPDTPVHVLTDIFRHTVQPVSRPATHRELSKQMPIRDVGRRLGVTHLTMRAWLQGSGRRAPLPITEKRVGRSRRLFVPMESLRSWLSAYRPDLLNNL